MEDNHANRYAPWVSCVPPAASPKCRDHVLPKNVCLSPTSRFSYQSVTAGCCAISSLPSSPSVGDRRSSISAISKSIKSKVQPTKSKAKKLISKRHIRARERLHKGRDTIKNRLSALPNPRATLLQLQESQREGLIASIRTAISNLPDLPQSAKVLQGLRHRSTVTASTEHSRLNEANGFPPIHERSTPAHGIRRSVSSLFVHVGSTWRGNATAGTPGSPTFPDGQSLCASIHAIHLADSNSKEVDNEESTGHVLDIKIDHSPRQQNDQQEKNQHIGHQGGQKGWKSSFLDIRERESAIDKMPGSPQQKTMTKSSLSLTPSPLLVSNSRDDDNYSPEVLAYTPHTYTYADSCPSACTSSGQYTESAGDLGLDNLTLGSSETSQRSPYSSTSSTFGNTFSPVQIKPLFDGEMNFLKCKQTQQNVKPLSSSSEYRLEPKRDDTAWEENKFRAPAVPRKDLDTEETNITNIQIAQELLELLRDINERDRRRQNQLFIAHVGNLQAVKGGERFQPTVNKLREIVDSTQKLSEKQNMLTKHILHLKFRNLITTSKNLPSIPVQAEEDCKAETHLETGLRPTNRVPLAPEKHLAFLSKEIDSVIRFVNGVNSDIDDPPSPGDYLSHPWSPVYTPSRCRTASIAKCRIGGGRGISADLRRSQSFDVRQLNAFQPSTPSLASSFSSIRRDTPTLTPKEVKNVAGPSRENIKNFGTTRTRDSLATIALCELTTQNLSEMIAKGLSVNIR